MTIEKALETIEDYILTNKIDVLDEAYIALMNGFSELQEKLSTLTADKTKVEEELEERKEMMWNNPMFRETILSQVRQAIRS